ncbi:MAG: hypothetical protein HFJ34_07000 [Clostridia bacterium]|nr:hypothetical protein [Clostridia bacterium]
MEKAQDVSIPIKLDEIIKAQDKILEVQQTTLENQKKMEKKQDEMLKEQEKMKEQMKRFEAEQKEMKEEMKRFEAEQKEMKEEMKTFQEEQQEMKEEIKISKNERQEMKKELLNLGNTVARIEYEHGRKLDIILDVLTGHTEKLEVHEKRFEKDEKITQIQGHKIYGIEQAMKK